MINISEKVLTLPLHCPIVTGGESITLFGTILNIKVYLSQLLIIYGCAMEQSSLSPFSFQSGGLITQFRTFLSSHKQKFRRLHSEITLVLK